MAIFKKNCDVCTKDLIDHKAALYKCSQAGSPSPEWWADPKIVIGGMAVSLGFGIVLGAVLSK